MFTVWLLYLNVSNFNNCIFILMACICIEYFNNSIFGEFRNWSVKATSIFARYGKGSHLLFFFLDTFTSTLFLIIYSSVIHFLMMYSSISVLMETGATVVPASFIWLITYIFLEKWPYFVFVWAFNLELVVIALHFNNPCFTMYSCSVFCGVFEINWRLV